MSIVNETLKVIVYSAALRLNILIAVNRSIEIFHRKLTAN